MAVDDGDHGREGIVEIGGAQAREKRAEVGCANLVGQRDGENHGKGEDECLSPVVAPEQEDEDGGVHRNPHKALGEYPHERVEEWRAHIVEKQENLCVNIDEVVYHNCKYSVTNIRNGEKKKGQGGENNGAEYEKS